MPAKDVTLTASYRDKLYKLTVNNGLGSGSYKAGAELLLVPNAAPSGKKFSKWVAGSASLDNARSEYASFIMPANDATVVATYRDAVANEKKDDAVTEEKLIDIFTEASKQSSEQLENILAEIKKQEAEREPVAVFYGYGYGAPEGPFENPSTGR